MYSGRSRPVASERRGTYVHGSPPARRGDVWRVLVVEQVLRNAERCERKVAAVRVARTSAEAIPLARDLQPDLLLLDPDLPDVDGWALLRRIVRDVQGCAAVIVTRRTTPEDISMDRCATALGQATTAHRLPRSSRACCWVGEDQLLPHPTIEQLPVL